MSGDWLDLVLGDADADFLRFLLFLLSVETFCPFGLQMTIWVVQIKRFKILVFMFTSTLTSWPFISMSVLCG